MPALNIVFQMGSLPENWSGTPQEFADIIATRLRGAASGDGITGQVGGAIPTSNVGLFFDTESRIAYMWDEELAKYLPFHADVPIGALMPWAGASAPSDLNWLLCNGAELNIVNYPALYAIIGTTYAYGEPPLVARLPDLRGRVPVGVGEGTYSYQPSADGLTGIRTDEIKPHVLGERFGAEWQEPTPRATVVGDVDNPRGRYDGTFSYAQVGRRNPAPTVQPPSLALNWIIKAK